MTVRRITRSVVAALAVLALGAPAAVAIPDYPTGPSPIVDSGPAASGPAPEPVSVPGPTVVVESDESSGFDWGSAAVGAGVLAGLVLLGGAATMTLGRNRRFRPTGGEAR